MPKKEPVIVIDPRLKSFDGSLTIVLSKDGTFEAPSPSSPLRAGGHRCMGTWKVARRKKSTGARPTGRGAKKK